MFSRDTLGYRLKMARMQNNLKVREVAEQLGVTSSYISMIENGKSNVSLKILMRLVPIYGVSIESLLHTPKSLGRVNHFSEMPMLFSNNEGMMIRALWTESDPDILRPYYYTLQPGVCTDFSQHSGIEFMLMLQGNAKITLICPADNSEEVYRMEQFDSIHYPSTWGHMCENDGNQPCVFLVVHTNSIVPNR